MGPSKDSKPKPKAGTKNGHQPESTVTSTDQPFVTPSTDNSGNTAAITESLKDSTLGRSKAWYGKGTWRRGSKATPVTQVAKESILAATDKASEVITTARSTALHGAAKRTESPSVSLSRSLRGPERSSPVIASTTKVDVTANSPINPLDGFQQSATSSAIPAQYEDPTSKQSDPNEMRTRNSGAKPDPPNDTTLAKLEGQEEKTSNETLHWRAWFSRTGELAKPEPPKASDTTDESSPHKCENTIYRRVSDPNMTISDANRHTLSLSWLGLWAATRSAKTGLADGAAVAAAPNLSIPSSSSQLPMPNAELASEAQSIQATSTDKSPGWAFWSRGTPGKPVGDAGQFEPGELVLAKPRGGVGPEYSVSNGTERASGKRPCSAEPIRRDQTSQPAQAQIQSKPLANPTKKQKTAFESEPLQANNTTSFRNLLLPPIRGTYPLAPRLSLLESLSRWWQDDRSSKTNHVQLLQNPPKIKKAIAIGIHGYFPAPLIRSVLGQPTGTSVRFADGAANAIQSWTSAHGHECEIEKVALEGEGRILERVDLLWKLLLSWIDNIRRADFVLVACHSQGVPVAIMLIAKLIDFGCVHDARIGVCAMAGINLGPFIDFKSRWIGGSAGELFDFARPDSQVSRDYQAALTTTLKFGARIAYVGSIDDQLVSLESSTFGTVDHPYLYRAVFVDGRIHAPDFLTHLVGFALKLRNLGVSDHGLIRELSSPLAGSLYGGEGHSKIYEDEAVYYLAVQNALETTATGESDLQRVREGVSSPQNPYILPFALRGVLEEDYVRNELQEETTELLRQFDDWKPSTKVLRDVKFRLEGVRSKL